MENEIANFNERVQALADTLMRTESVFTIATRLAEYMIKEKDRIPVRITVSEDEWVAIQSLFRVRGTRVNGQEERRGRPKKL